MEILKQNYTKFAISFQGVSTPILRLVKYMGKVR